MHDTHRKAAEQHELAAHAHRTAAEHHEKGDDEAGRWHAERALETRIMPINLQRKPIRSLGKLGRFDHVNAI